MRQLAALALLLILAGCTPPAAGEPAPRVQVPAEQAAQPPTANPPAAETPPPETPVAEAEPAEPIQWGCELRRDDSEPWSSVPASAVMAPGPVQIRLRAPLPIADAAVSEWADIALKGVTHEISRIADGIVVQMPSPPPRFEFAFPGGRAACVVYFGTAPTTVALDPLTGAETVLPATPPVDVYDSSLSPDGQWAALVAWSPHRVYRGEIYLMATQGGAIMPVGDAPLPDPYYGVPLFWTRDALIAPGGESILVRPLAGASGAIQKSRGRFWGPPSPDGRTLPGFFHNPQKTREYFVAASIVLHDLVTGQEQVFPDAAWAFWPPKATPPRIRFGWSPDGALLIDATAVQTEPVRRLDPESGQVTVTDLAALPRAAAPSWPQWGPVLVTGPDGVERTWGEGWVLGRRPDGKLLVLRWPLYQERRPGPLFP